MQCFNLVLFFRHEITVITVGLSVAPRADVPDRHPQCVWGPATDPQHFHFNCSWLGAYPSPNLTWVDEGGAGGQLHQWALADGLSLRLNRSELWDGQTLRCRAQHPVLADTDKNSCSFTFSKSGWSNHHRDIGFLRSSQ